MVEEVPQGTSSAKLFRRLSKKRERTENEIVEAGKVILKHVNEIEYKSTAYSGKLSGKLKISIVSTAKYIMKLFIANNFDLTNNFVLYLIYKK